MFGITGDVRASSQRLAVDTSRSISYLTEILNKSAQLNYYIRKIPCYGNGRFSSKPGFNGERLSKATVLQT